MLQNVLTNKHLTLQDVKNKYNKQLCLLGDKLEMNSKFGSKNNIDTLKFIKLKTLKPLVDSFEENDNKCCLAIQNKQQLLNTLSTVIN